MADLTVITSLACSKIYFFGGQKFFLEDADYSYSESLSEDSEEIYSRRFDKYDELSETPMFYTGGNMTLLLDQVSCVEN